MTHITEIIELTNERKIQAVELASAAYLLADFSNPQAASAFLKFTEDQMAETLMQGLDLEKETASFLEEELRNVYHGHIMMLLAQPNTTSAVH